MTRKECKENLEIIKAFADGKVIECKDIKTNDYCNWTETICPDFNFDTFEYRIKPEETYRPYKDTDEMIADYEAKIMARFDFEPTDFDMPLIWVKNNTSGIKYLITSYASVSVGITDTYVSVQDLFAKYTYLDGTPIGVKE